MTRQAVQEELGFWRWAAKFVPYALKDCLETAVLMWQNCLRALRNGYHVDRSQE